MGGLNWEEFLKELVIVCLQIDKDFVYYKQLYVGDFKKIGIVFIEVYCEWVWGKGKSKFFVEYFDVVYLGDVFIKYMVVELLVKFGLLVKGLYGIVELDVEIVVFKNMSLYVIIIMNYD